MLKRLSLVILVYIHLVLSLDIECEYGIFDSNHAYGDKYRCLVKNAIDIDLPDEVQIESITGDHMSGKSDDSDIHFHISKQIQYFPRGLEKFYKNLKGIIIWHSQLKEIHQDDLKPYPDLNNLYLSGNGIEIIEDGLFDYNPDIKVIIFENTKLFHISPTAFNNLANLKTLFFNGNICTNLYSVQNRAVTLKVIKGVKNSCTSSDFLSLKKKLENLEEVSGNSIIASSQIYSQNVINFQTEFKDSKFATFSPLKQRFQKLIKSSNENSCHLEEPYQNILKVVDSKIEDLESRMTRKIEEILDEKLEKVMINVKKIITLI
ncbi:unnamed protein product [Chironomus riparius]|uniref:Uncharacterized protein n=1 Tax=Chironomus riparius TaxID=315576 RepID=A0A9N9X142_9DIPT|nr:unnamed protein product [Chironomus riparius]